MPVIGNLHTHLDWRAAHLYGRIHRGTLLENDRSHQRAAARGEFTGGSYVPVTYMKHGKRYKKIWSATNVRLMAKR